MEVQNNIFAYNHIASNIKSDNVPTQIVLKSTSENTSIFNTKDKHNRTPEEKSNSPKLPIKYLKQEIPTWRVNEDYIRSTLIGGASAGLLIGIIIPSHALTAAVFGIALGALMVKCKYSYETYKNQKDINNLQKYYNKLTDKQKKQINKQIEDDYFYAYKKIPSYIKQCKKFICENWIKNFLTY